MKQVASELSITEDGVYKAIRRNKLKAIRLSERQVRVPRPALTAYQRRLAGDSVPVLEQPVHEHRLEDVLAVFSKETETTPDAWLASWKADELEDSAENATITMAALALTHWAQLPASQHAAAAFALAE